MTLESGAFGGGTTKVTFSEEVDIYSHEMYSSSNWTPEPLEMGAVASKSATL